MAVRSDIIIVCTGEDKSRFVQAIEKNDYYRSMLKIDDMACGLTSLYMGDARWYEEEPTEEAILALAREIRDTGRPLLFWRECMGWKEVITNLRKRKQNQDKKIPEWVYKYAWQR